MIYTTLQLASNWLTQFVNNLNVKVMLQTTVSRPVFLGVRQKLGPMTNFSFSLKFSSDSCGFIILWHPHWWENRAVIYCCCLASPTQSFLDLSPVGLKIIFYCPNFWDFPTLEGQVPVFLSPRDRLAQLYPQALDSLSVISYDSQGYGGVILTCLHTG
jgi:hypothetical protein